MAIEKVLMIVLAIAAIVVLTSFVSMNVNLFEGGASHLEIPKNVNSKIIELDW
jgi:cell division protein FtsL